LGFNRNLAIRTKLRSQPRKEQSEKMVNLGNRSHGALSTTSTCALLDADGGRNAGDEIDIRAGKLLDELAGIKVHGIQEPPLPLGKEQIKRESAFA